MLSDTAPTGSHWSENYYAIGDKNTICEKKKQDVGNSDVSRLICRPDSPQVRSPSGGSRNAEGTNCESTCVLQRRSRARLAAERLAARPVDTFANDERNVIGIGDLSGKSIPLWFLSRLAPHNVSRFSGADNERDQNTLSDLFSANVFTNKFLMQIPISPRGELTSANKLR